MEIPAFSRMWTVSVSLWLQLQSIHPSVRLFSPGFSASDREALQSPTVGRPSLADHMLGSGVATAVIMWFSAYGVQLQPNQLSATNSGAFAKNLFFFFFFPFVLSTTTQLSIIPYPSCLLLCCLYQSVSALSVSCPPLPPL